MFETGRRLLERGTARKVSKYGVISGPYFPVFSPNTGKYGPEITPYLDTFHVVKHNRHLLSKQSNSVPFSIFSQ